MLRRKYVVVISFIGLLLIANAVFSLPFFTNSKDKDWPMWRYDANRSAASPHKLSDKLHLQWVRDYPVLTQAWDDPFNRDLMQYDKVYEPVVQGKTMFVGSNASDWMVALDTETGAEKWSFYVDGPVRFPPVAHNGNVYFVSDDGYLYCVDGEQGTLTWKFRGGPSDRKILGNERMISTWPARGGPVLKDGIIYFGAGIWPFMGIFIYALDAETGELIWKNDSSGPLYITQPHNSPSYSGVAPQGAFVVSEDKLLVPCGRSIPACFDLQTGELSYYHLAVNKKNGGSFVSALGNYFVNYHRSGSTSLYDLSSGDSIVSRFGAIPVMTEKTLFSMGSSITAFDLGNLRQVEQADKLVVDATGKKVKIVKDKKWTLDQLWKSDIDASGDLIKAGKRLYAGGKDMVSAVSIPRYGTKTKVKWQTNIEGTAARLIAADDKLFVVTLEGRIYAFGKEKAASKVHIISTKKPNIARDARAKAKDLLKATGVKEGYCLAYGLETGDLIAALAQESELRIIAIDPDPVKVDSLRRKFHEAGIYGKKLSVQVGTLFDFDAPPYVASLTVFESLEAVGDERGDDFFKKIYKSLRPYGGIACLPVSSNEMPTLAKRIQAIELPKAKVRKVKRIAKSLKLDGYVFLTRSGSLPGADDWTHQYGDAANTAKSDDKLVKAPLGMLWFGGSSNMDVLPRHGHGPPEQVVGGRLFIQGVDGFSARDVYTGRVLWKAKLSNLNTLGLYHDEADGADHMSSQAHLPGANARGTNFVATLDKLYVAKKNSCVVLDSVTGEIIEEFRLPPDPKTGIVPGLGYIGVYKDYLLLGVGFASYKDFIELDEYEKNVRSSKLRFYDFDVTSSKKLVVMDRHTGETIWSRDARLGFRHTAIAVGDNKLFCIDKVPPMIADTLRRRSGKYPFETPKLMALNIHTGNVIWDTTRSVFGTTLGYSEEYDTLLQARRNTSDMLRGEPGKSMAAYSGKNGAVRWNKDISYSGVNMLHGDTIITSKYAYNLLTGERKKRVDPLTGNQASWAFKRNYGCNYAIASEHLLTFRSAAAGFFDLANDGGTGNFGGFKSSCTSNLVVANGVLNAPDYTRTCTCSYQNQTSLAMVHMPEVEIWTDNFYPNKGKVISSSASAIAFFDTAGDLTCANASFLTLLGYDKHFEVLEKSVTSFIQSDETAEGAIATLLGEGEWSGELVALKKDGTTLDVYLSMELGLDAAGVPDYAMVSLVDVDAGAVALFDLEGKLTYANDVFLSLLEYSDNSEVLGKSISDFWETEDNITEDSIEDSILDTLLSKKTWKGEVAAVKEDGSNLDTYLSASMATDADGKSAFISASFVDLTEQKETKEVADQLDAALSASCDIKQLITDDKPIRSVGINFGAPGDRKADNGTLWLEYPIVGGPSPEVAVSIDHDKLLFKIFDVEFHTDLDKGTIAKKLRREFQNKNISFSPHATVTVEKKGSKWLIDGSRRRRYIIKKAGYWLNVYKYERFSHHSSRIQGEGLKWVAASGVKGVSSLTISLAKKLDAVITEDNNGEFPEAFIAERLYTVRLYFSEPDSVTPGERRFDVAIQGQEKLKDFDIIKEAGGQNRPVVKEFRGIPVTWDLTVTLTPSDSATSDPLICGIEVAPEG